MSDTPPSVTKLRWSTDPCLLEAGTLTYIPCASPGGQRALLALDDRERRALGQALLNDSSALPGPTFFRPGRLYRRDSSLFRCEFVAPHPATSQPRAFGYQSRIAPRPRWGSAVVSDRAWRHGWQDITCPEHGYQCSPLAPCPTDRP